MHGGFLQQRFLARREGVQPGGNDTLDRFRQHAGRPTLREHADVLLGEERIAARALEQRSLLVRKLEWLLEERRDEPCGLIVAERAQRNRRGICFAASPAMAALEQLRPRGRDHEEWNAVKPVDNVVEEIEKAVVGPMQVLEHEHGRPAFGDRFKKPSPRRRGGTTMASLARETDKRA